MAGIRETSASFTIPVTSHDTALCILPPVEQCEHIDSLRELYDKAYGRWPAHINLVYPFVVPERLPQAQQQIQAQLQRNLVSSATRRIKLESAGLFRQRHNSTTILQESRDSSDGSLETLRSLALQALGHKPTRHTFHLTVGQTVDNSMSSLEFLISKARLLPTLDFEIGSLAILVRERTSGEHSANRMRLWGLVDTISPPTVSTVPMPEYWLNDLPTSAVDEDQEDDEDGLSSSTAAFSRAVQPGKTFFFDHASSKWVKMMNLKHSTSQSTSLTVSSYNVLVDSEYPPARDRDPLLITTLLSDPAKADIVVLQEVSDDFLSFLLNNAEVQGRYPFTSHGPPSQPDIGPLLSLRNVVVISKWPFRWELVPFHRRHKGAVVAVFDSITTDRSLVVAGIHLTCGLTDGSVTAKKVQVQNLLNHLTRRYSNNPWVIAGDFNLATSAHTIANALKGKSITSQTGNTLAAIEDQLSGNGILDAWSVTRDEQPDETHCLDTDELFEGEEGATFDPRNNILAAATSGTSKNRSQRYDRILVRPLEALRVTAFSMFGLPAEVNGTSVVPSDHYGVRASLQLSRPTEQLSPNHREMLNGLKVEVQRASQVAAQELESTLHRHRMFLTEEQNLKRQAAFALLKGIVLGISTNSSSTAADIPLVMVTVGSFALDVDTSTSDIDCLCIGSISSKTFFKLARQRLQKADSQVIRILRKVKASTGTMLELSVNGVPMDLQYCPAARVVERWSEFEDLPASDPIFNLSVLSLRKLKPYRDLLYIQHTMPDLATFGLAYRAIKLWATQRGIYSSKFGFLGGVHITLMLSWVYKRIEHDVNTRDSHPIGANDLVATFFHHYANFNWADDMVFDAFFHKQRPRYHRTAREPMVVLGFHSPNSNIAHQSTLPGLVLLTKEFKAASARLSEPAMTWQDFFEPSGAYSFAGMGFGETLFLQTYKSYVSIDIQFWGRTLAKGKSLVGWVESRCLSLVVDTHKNFPNLEVRLWPARFTENKQGEPDKSKDYHGCYLIGLQRAANAPLAPKSHVERQAAKQSLEKVINRFLNQLRTDEKNYDASTSWVNALLVTQHDVQAQKLRLDDRDWGDYAMEIEPDSDDEEELDDPNDEDAELPKLPIRSKPISTSTPVSTTKLRPASDVLNRLRWDSNLDPAEYIIGYEDRFLGAKESSLEKWKTEQTDEEFIPQHRILYFRRKFNDESDGKGELVWERKTRIDKVFGSGAGSGVLSQERGL
ncbi:hypothetical protein BU25DRAFT_262141 [Macroventuria anomochaeta]|uniref:Uncharacterized protein n=1 Tax=Macroventuria anomochaeta TaxID=301207 RepID=A0ACB6S9D7_9PLEO|nr:uncharacterized protein BU25DRAFT_262141 [Macroventuria anomochaeta]KAF2629963.1 hypothetical protein BU25DRAFT_262141 [Macroventuria anomochaeta]